LTSETEALAAKKQKLLQDAVEKSGEGISAIQGHTLAIREDIKTHTTWRLGWLLPKITFISEMVEKIW
jgi:hypothetical protein